MLPPRNDIILGLWILKCNLSTTTICHPGRTFPGRFLASCSIQVLLPQFDLMRRQFPNFIHERRNIDLSQQTRTCWSIMVIKLQRRQRSRSFLRKNGYLRHNLCLRHKSFERN